jgi:hypothetical protein
VIRRLAAVAATCLLTLPAAVAAARRTGDASFLLPNDGFTPLTAEQMAIRDVSFAPGAPVVVLLDGRQDEWQGVGGRKTELVQMEGFIIQDTDARRGEDLNSRKAYIHRRWKILTQAGVDDAGDYTHVLYGDWRVSDVKARTILPDGTIVDASSGIFREDSDKESKRREIRIAFPQVQVGAILDLFMNLSLETPHVRPWTVQERWPVLESRYVMVPPLGLNFRTALVNMPGAKLDPIEIARGRATAFAWVFEDVPPLPDAPFLPPDDEVAGTLLLILESYTSGSVHNAIAADWKSWIAEVRDDWEQWLKKDTGKAASLAASVCAGASTPRAKAEAVRRAVLERVRWDADIAWMFHDSPDEVLDKGSGWSGDAAGLAIAMLRSVGVTAVPADIRLRSDGALPKDVPVPTWMNHVLVRVGSGSDAFFFSPTHDVPVGSLPDDCTGVLAVVYEKGLAAPFEIPEITADQNRAERSADLALDASGKLTGQLAFRFAGARAQEWRADLRNQTEDKQVELVRERVQWHVPGAQVSGLQVIGLDDPTADLVLGCAFEAEGYATRAGRKLLVNPHVLARIDAADWAAETRALPIDLGLASSSVDTVRITLPPGVTDVTLPPAGKLTADKVGRYELAIQPAEDGRSATISRLYRLDRVRFPKEAWNSLRSWHQAIAKADDAPFVLELQ